MSPKPSHNESITGFKFNFGKKKIIFIIFKFLICEGEGKFCRVPL